MTRGRWLAIGGLVAVGLVACAPAAPAAPAPQEKRRTPTRAVNPKGVIGWDIHRREFR
jgi:hypothetical protein